MTTTTHRSESSGAHPPLCMAIELSEKTWKLAFGTAAGAPPRLRTVRAGAAARVLDEIASAKRHRGLAPTTRVVSCYEAGRDGFWLHRYLQAAGVENHVIDPSSIEVPRRARRAKTDRLDAGKLLALVLRMVGGERQMWRPVRVPSDAEEDARQVHRSLATVVSERARVVNRIKGVLVTQGVRVRVDQQFRARVAAVRRWDGTPLPPGLQHRLATLWAHWQHLTVAQRQLEQQRRALAAAGTSVVARQAAQLQRLRGIDASAWVFASEAFAWRRFRNGRQLGAFLGLAPTPAASGTQHRELGISKAGHRHLRATAVQIAWGWVRWQPTSALSQWYRTRFATAGGRARRIGIVAVARKLVIALWRFVESGVLPEGAVLKPAPA